MPEVFIQCACNSFAKVKKYTIICEQIKSRSKNHIWKPILNLVAAEYDPDQAL